MWYELRSEIIFFISETELFRFPETLKFVFLSYEKAQSTYQTRLGNAYLKEYKIQLWIQIDDVNKTIF